MESKSYRDLDGVETKIGTDWVFFHRNRTSSENYSIEVESGGETICSKRGISQAETVEILSELNQRYEQNELLRADRNYTGGRRTKLTSPVAEVEVDAEYEFWNLDLEGFEEEGSEWLSKVKDLIPGLNFSMEDAENFEDTARLSIEGYREEKPGLVV